MAIRIDVVVGVIDRGDESPAFIPFVGMLVGSCFNSKTLRRRRRGAHVGAGPVDARSDVARDAGDDGRSTICNTSKLDVLGVSYKMGEERWCLAICHTNYQ